MNPILKGLRATVAAVAVAALAQSVGSVALSPLANASNSQVTATSDVNIRAAASASSARVGILYKGQQIQSISSSQGWTAVTHEGRTAYVATAYLTSNAAVETPSPSTKGEVHTTGNLNLRTGPSLSSAVSRVVTKGTKLVLTGTISGSYSQVEYGSTTLWAATSYLSSGVGAPSTPTPPSTTVRYATANLNIWSAATGSAHSGQIPRGSAVAVTGKVSGGRAEIVHNGAMRWVTARYLMISAPGAVGGNASPGGSLNKGHSSGLDQTNANTKKVIRHIWATQPAITTMYGWRRDATPDHPGGRAVDVMLPNYKSNSALGWEIASYYRANAAEFGITYIIFDQQIWSVQRNNQGWRKMSSRGNDTANHKDHVHINT